MPSRRNIYVFKKLPTERFLLILNLLPFETTKTVIDRGYW